jgi:hypothetical protein
MDNLGPAEPWQIRSFPKGLRERLIDEAHATRCSVGELLTAIVLRHYDQPASGASNNALDAVQLAPLVPAMPRWLRAALWRRVAGQLGIEPPHRPRKALTHGP